MRQDPGEKYSFLVIALLLCLVLIVVHRSEPIRHQTTYKTIQSTGWNNAKRVLYDVIYKDHDLTLYYGCFYTGFNIDLSSCDYDSKTKRSKRVEAEHIVPASLFPARQFECWKMGRNECEKNDPRAQGMLYDLHNLAPAVGQVNADRSNKRYGETEGKFEPQDCVKGDVARIWLYAKDRWGVEFEPGEQEMFERWSGMDPVSPWESEREKRIRKYTFVSNPYIKGQKPDLSGSCPWER